MNFPKWKYRKHPALGVFQSMLVATPEAEQAVGPTWTDNPHEHGIEVVPYPAELVGGRIIHHGTGADANGKFAHGPAPTSPGVANANVR